MNFTRSSGAIPDQQPADGICSCRVVPHGTPGNRLTWSSMTAPLSGFAGQTRNRNHMTNTTSDPMIIKLTKRPVRLSYPSLFTAKEGPDGGKATFSAVFLLDKKANADDIRAIQQGIALCIKEGLKGKHPGADRICLRDGSAKPDTDGYGDGVMFISARNEKRPGVVDQQLSPLTTEDGKPYAGCYVYATLRLWAQDNKFGKRVNASLRNVQFVKDGEPFGEKPVAPEDDFEPVDENLV